MRQTLFVISHEWITSYLLPIWIGLVLVGVVVQGFRRGWSRELLSWLWVGLIGSAVILFVLPAIELKVPSSDDPQTLIPVGLPIRGFGVMFLLATVSGVGISLRRATQMGVDRDVILSLVFWMFIAGISGARLFYVIEYREQFTGESWLQLLGRVVNTTQGGIVVYGSLIGGLTAAVVFCLVKKLPMLATGDLLAPGMALGLAIGRLGCFMNGCCYGGECDWPVAVQFPRVAPPYLHQIETGSLIGVTTRSIDASPWREVIAVEPESWAANKRVEVGDRMLPPAVSTRDLETAGDAAEEVRSAVWRFESASGEEKPSLILPLMDLPERSRPVHPTQLYSGLNALLLCAFLWFYYPFRYGDGEVIGVGLILYPIARVLLEAIRVDEAGQFGTSLSISQWTSLPMLLLGITLVVTCRLTRKNSALPPTTSIHVPDSPIAASGSPS